MAAGINAAAVRERAIEKGLAAADARSAKAKSLTSFWRRVFYRTENNGRVGRGVGWMWSAAV